MYEQLRGKKLLIVGADVNDMEIIRCAQSMGIYTIASDWCLDYSKSPAKRLADEAWDINYRDIDAMVARCITENVDGVMAGYSETRVLLAAEICRKLNKPFYATENIVQLTRDKRSFKFYCEKYGVPIPKEYCKTGILTDSDYEEIQYPVIVKPADCGGRFGITICNIERELKTAVKKALFYSENKTVVIEEYVEGLEMCSIYNIADGEIMLALVNDKYQVIINGRKSVLCNTTVSPSKHIEEYMKTVDPYIKAFLKGIGAKNGIAFFQMVASKNGIRVFEMGYRLNGGNDQHIIEKYNHINHMKMLISYSLTGNMGDDINKNNPVFPEYLGVYLAYVHGGIVGKMNCVSKVGENGVIAITQKIFPGSKVVDNETTQQEAYVIKFSADSIEDMAKKIDSIADGIIVDDTEGRNLLFERFDTQRLYE